MHGGVVLKKGDNSVTLLGEVLGLCKCSVKVRHCYHAYTHTPFPIERSRMVKERTICFAGGSSLRAHCCGPFAMGLQCQLDFQSGEWLLLRTGGPLPSH